MFERGRRIEYKTWCLWNCCWGHIHSCFSLRHVKDFSDQFCRCRESDSHCMWVLLDWCYRYMAFLLLVKNAFRVIHSSWNCWAVLRHKIGIFMTFACSQFCSFQTIQKHFKSFFLLFYGSFWSLHFKHQNRLRRFWNGVPNKCEDIENSVSKFQWLLSSQIIEV